MTQDENLRDSVDSTEAAVSRAEEARRRKASHARSGEAEVPPTRRAGFHPLAREPKSTVQIGDVRYYDGAELSRPLETPPRVRAIMLAAMVVAAVIGCLFLGRYFDQIMNEPIRQQQTLQENLAREVSYDFPLLSSLMPLSDEEIMTALTDATLYTSAPPWAPTPTAASRSSSCPPTSPWKKRGSCTCRASTSCRPATP